MKRLRVLAAALCVLAAPAYAQVQGQDYELLNPAQPTSSPDKVEVIEFFSYGCPHCYAMQPQIEKWAAQLPENTSFMRIPVSFGRREWGQLSRAYYALEATGDLARLDDAVFDGIHKEHKQLFSEDALAAWAAENGIDAAKFRAAFESPGVSAKAMRAEQLSRDYRVNSVPHVIVDGKYIVKGKTHEETLKIARQLVDKAAAEKKIAKR
jgi:protein dithiol oxidoreductase (disulfide-forming)